MVSQDDETIELRRITILERNLEFSAAAERCSLLYEKTQDPALAIRGFKNRYAHTWRSQSLPEMGVKLDDLLADLRQAQGTLKLDSDQAALLNVLMLKTEGWLAHPPDPDKMIGAVEIHIERGEIAQALDLVTSLIAFIDTERQIQWTKDAIQLAKKLPKDDRDAYFLLLVEPLIFYAEGPEQQELLELVFERIEILAKTSDRTHLQNIALLKGLDLLHPYQIEVNKAEVIREENTHELVRSLANATHNRTRGMILSLLGTSYSRLAELEKKPATRQELFKKARDYFLQSVSTLERTPAYGELLHAYTLAGEGFLSIAELEQDFEQRNKYYSLGKEHLQKSQLIGKSTQLYHIRSRAAINLGIALERMAWLELDPEHRRETLLATFQLYLGGRDLAATVKHQIHQGYATTKASEICGFLSDLESQRSKKLEWATQQRDLSQTGLKILEQTADRRGLVVALSNVAFAFGKLSMLTSQQDEKQALLEEMLKYGEQAVKEGETLLDSVVSAFAFQQAAVAAECLGILTINRTYLRKAVDYYSQAVKAWSKTGERHKQAEAVSKQATVLLFQSSSAFGLSREDWNIVLVESEQLYQTAADLYGKLYFLHDVGETYWRMGQIRLLQSDFFKAQEYFDLVQKSFDQVAQLLPHFAGIYNVFKTLGITLVGLVDGVNIIARGNYDHAILLFDDLAQGLETETDRNLRHLRQLILALSSISRFIAFNDEEEKQNAQDELKRLQGQLSLDAYEQALPFSLHTTINRLQNYLTNPHQPFPPLLFDLPIQEKMMAMTQTRHIVSTAMSLYESTTDQRGTVSEEPSEDVIRNYVQRISAIIANR